MEVLPFQSLPLGFRFRPTDVELIDHYLRLKINGNDKDVSAIREVDVCKVEPWDLPDLSMIKTADREWFFFCPRDRKYPNGQRSNRATCAGYWKATGKDRKIVSRRLGLIGMKKTLVFHMGRAPMGQRTCWIIHEYRSTLRELDGTQPGQGAFVICRLFKKHDDKKQEDDNEGSDCDEGETLVSSRNATNTSHEDLQSEPGLVQESPVLGGHIEEQPPARSDNCGVEVSDQTASYILAAPEEDSNLDEALKYFYDPQGPPSPLHMHMELVSAKMATPLDSGFGNGYSGMQFQTAGYGKDPISDFLDSVLINPDDYPFEETEGQGAPFFESVLWNNNSISQGDLFIKESESCSGSDMEGTQAQGALVICCLFKKHDDKKQEDDNEGFDCDEGETLVSSRNATNTSHEDLPSEPGFEDSNLDEALKYFYDPQEPPSPLHRMHMELVSAKMAPPLDYGFSNGYSGMQFQTAGYGKDPISDFPDSVLINPDDYPFEETEGQGAPFSESVLWNNNSISQRDLFIKESGSCSGSDMEGTQAQHDVAFLRHVSVCSLGDKQGGNLHSKQDTAFADDDMFSDAALSRFCNLPHSFQEPSACSRELVDYNIKLESGIKIRTHLRRSHPTTPNIVEQGTALRRIRLHNVLECNTQDHEAEPTHTKASGLSTQDGENSCHGNELSGLMGVNVKLSSAFFTSLPTGYARMIRNVHIRSIGFSSRRVSSPSMLGVVAMVVVLFMVFIALYTQNTSPRAWFR